MTFQNAFNNYGISVIIGLFPSDTYAPIPIMRFKGVATLFTVSSRMCVRRGACPLMLLQISRAQTLAFISFFILLLGSTLLTTVFLYVYRYSQTARRKTLAIYMSRPLVPMLVYALYVCLLCIGVLMPLWPYWMSKEEVDARCHQRRRQSVRVSERIRNDGWRECTCAMQCTLSDTQRALCRSSSHLRLCSQNGRALASRSLEGSV